MLSELPVCQNGMIYSKDFFRLSTTFDQLSQPTTSMLSGLTLQPCLFNILHYILLTTVFFGNGHECINHPVNSTTLAVRNFVSCRAWLNGYCSTQYSQEDVTDRSTFLSTKVAGSNPVGGPVFLVFLCEAHRSKTSPLSFCLIEGHSYSLKGLSQGQRWTHFRCVPIFKGRQLLINCSDSKWSFLQKANIGHI